MDVTSLWQFGHEALLGGLENAEWGREVSPGWSLKDAISNLAAMEYVLGEVIESIVFGSDTPTLDRFVADYDRFNRDELAERRKLSGEEVLEEYRYAYAQNRLLLSHVPRDKWRQRGTVTWFGPDFSLEDFVVLFMFEHKRECIAQIMQTQHNPQHEVII